MAYVLAPVTYGPVPVLVANPINCVPDTQRDASGYTRNPARCTDVLTPPPPPPPLPPTASPSRRYSKCAKMQAGLAVPPLGQGRFFISAPSAPREAARHPSQLLASRTLTCPSKDSSVASINSFPRTSPIACLSSCGYTCHT